MNSGRRYFLRSLAAAPLAFANPAAASDAEPIAPYIQNVDEDRAVLMWSAMERGAGQVEWLCSNGEWRTLSTQSLEFPSSETGLGFSFYQHSAEINNLSPGSTVQYRVRWNDQLHTGLRGAFRTPARNRVFESFLAFGDSGTGSPEQMALMRQMSTEDPSFIVHTGDLAYPTASYERLQETYFKPYSGLMARIPFFPCLGNHDYACERARAYLRTHTLPTHPDIPNDDKGRYYSFQWGPIRIFCLDSNEPLDDSRGGMLHWLKADLARNRSFWRVAVFHHIPYTAGKHKGDYFVRLARERLAPILEEAGVPLVLAGHEHLYQRSHPIRGGEAVPMGSGTVYVATGGGGGGLYPFASDPLQAVGRSVYHYVRVRLEGYRMIAQAVGLDGIEFDRVHITPRPGIAAGSPVNSANFQPRLASGGLATIFGEHFALTEERYSGPTIPTSAREMVVTLDGKPLPLLFASPTQINVQLPYTGSRTARLQVSTPNGSSETTLEIEETAPAFFQVRADGILRPAVFASDGGHLISARNPAARGRQVTAFLTGLGDVQGSPEPGQLVQGPEGPAVLAPVTIRLGATLLTPESAHLAPGLPGVYRVTFRVPESAPTGEVELRLHSGAASSEPSRLTLA